MEIIKGTKTVFQQLAAGLVAMFSIVGWLLAAGWLAAGWLAGSWLAARVGPEGKAQG